MNVGPSGNEAQETSEGYAPKAKLVLQIVIYVVIMAAITFLVAGRWNWWMAWAYFVLYGIAMVVAVLVVPLDKQLVDERRKIKEDVKRWDKWLTAPLSWVYPFGMFILVALEMRFGQALRFPLWAQIAGLVALLLGQLLGTWAMAVNKFYGRFVRIQRERGHYVVSDGPYRFIRHPGYLGVIVGAFGTTFAIGSLWALVLSIVISVLLIVRTVLEDKVLLEELEGYEAYAQETRFRLVPGIW
jgi:protein-S-isoprenylcysteine O-methyltransferase Ste14